MRMQQMNPRLLRQEVLGLDDEFEFFLPLKILFVHQGTWYGTQQQ